MTDTNKIVVHQQQEKKKKKKKKKYTAVTNTVIIYTFIFENSFTVYFFLYNILF